MFWGNRTPRERILAVVAIVLLVLGACGRASGEEGQSSACYARDGLREWSSGLVRRQKPAVAQAKSMELGKYLADAQKIEDQLTVLCAQTAEQGSAHWLIGADEASHSLSSLAFRSSLSLVSVAHSQEQLSMLSLVFSGELNLMRAKAYERVQTKEVVREVQVQAQCPEVQAAPPNPCAETLRSGARQWSGDLYTWSNSLFSTGPYYEFARDSRPTLTDLARSDEDPVPVIVGWLAQYRSVDRTNRQSGSSSGPLPRVAADMRARLSVCGFSQPDQDR